MYDRVQCGSFNWTRRWLHPVLDCCRGRYPACGWEKNPEDDQNAQYCRNLPDINATGGRLELFLSWKCTQNECVMFKDVNRMQGSRQKKRPQYRGVSDFLEEYLVVTMNLAGRRHIACRNGKQFFVDWCVPLTLFGSISFLDLK